MENSQEALEARMTNTKSVESANLGANNSLLQDTWDLWSKKCSEHKTIGAAVLMVGGIAIHDGKTSALAAKTLGQELLKTGETALAKELMVTGEKALVKKAASTEVPALLSDVIKQRYPGANIYDIGNSSIDDGLKLLAKPNQSGAFNAITRGDELVAVKLPDGGFPYASYPKSDTLVNQGNYWKAQPRSGYNAYDVNGEIKLVKTPTGPELHVVDKDCFLKSVHYADGRVSLENTTNGALVEADPLFRNIVRLRDTDGTTFTTQYLVKDETKALRYGANGELETLPSGQKATYKFGDGSVAVKTRQGETYHALDGKQYATESEARIKSAEVFQVSRTFSGRLFQVETHFPTEYVSGGIVTTRGGVMRQISHALDVSTAEKKHRQAMRHWLGQ